MSVLHATTSAPKLLRHPYFPAWPFDPTQNPYRAWNTKLAYYTASQAFFCTIGQRPIKSRSSWFGNQYPLMTVNGEIVPCLNEPQQSNITGISEAETDEDKIFNVSQSTTSRLWDRYRQHQSTLTFQGQAYQGWQLLLRIARSEYSIYEVTSLQ